MASTPTDILSKLNVGSGMNTADIVSSLVDSERLPQLQRIEKYENQTENKISAYGILKNNIRDFRDSVRTIKNTNAASHIGSSSNTTIATFTTSGSTGSENIDSSLLVSSLATTHTLVTGEYDNTGSTVGSGSLTIDFGTWSTTSSANDTFTANSNSSVTINTTSTTTLSQLRDAINNATDNAVATIMYNGSGYVLVIKGESGASNEIRVTPDGSSSNDLINNYSYTSSTKNLTQTSDGVDASFTVDGISMTRSTNTISNLFQGYTLELESTSSSAINISSSQNLDTIENLLNNFVENYNAVYLNISDMTTNATTSTETAGPLSGDSLARTIQRELRGFTSQSIVGYENGPYSLSLLGIQTNRDGTIALNTSTLKKSFERNPIIVDAVFKNQLNSDNSDVSITSLGTDTKPGTYAVTQSSGNYLIDGASMSASGNNYTSSSGNSSGMVLNISSGVTSANIYYGESLMTSIDESLTNFLSFNGDISKRINNLSERLIDIEDEKTHLEERMSALEERYTFQFAAMEQAIAGLQETGNYLDQMLKSSKE